MRRIFISLLVISLFFVSCNKFSKDASIESDPKTGAPILVGKIQLQDLKREPFNQWFEQGYSEYVIDSVVLDSIDRRHFSVVVVLATWCPDSRREVPRMFKILDYLDIPQQNITIYCVDRNKKAGKFDISQYEVKRVPTFIFIEKGKELGRIIERPQKSLEKDLKEILSR